MNLISITSMISEYTDGRIISFDVASVAILIALLALSIAEKNYKTISEKTFLVFIISSLLASIFDIGTVLRNIPIPLEYTFNELYFIVRNSIPLIYIYYCLKIVGLDGKVGKMSYINILLTLPYLAICALVIISPWNGFVFNISKDGEYIRGNGIYILYGYAVFYLLISLFILIKYHNFFRKGYFLSLLSMYPFVIAGILVQLINSDYLIECLSTTLALVLVYMTVADKSVYIEKKTGLSNKLSYEEDIKRSYILKTNNYVLYIKIFNISKIYQNMTFKAVENYIDRVSKRLLSGYRKYGFYKAYYLENGVFAISTYNKEKLDKIKDEIIKDLNSTFCEEKRFIPDGKTVTVSIKNDFDTLNKALSFDGLLSKVFFGKSNDINYSFKKNDSLFEMKVNLKSILADAIVNKTFEVYYQPIYNLKDKSFNCVEALIRLNHPKYGFISPGYFIPFAEENGLVEKIDEIMLEKVIEFIKSKEFKKYKIAYVEINISTIELAKKNFGKELVELLKKNNINTDNIVVEVLESYNSSNIDTISRNIQVLRDNNIKLALDDFGTGYSNLKRFTEIDLSYVKIDKSLIDKIENPVYTKIIENQFDLIREFGRKIVAEGVEEENQVKLLEKMNCDYIQGFYYSRPLPLSNLIQFLDEN